MSVAPPVRFPMARRSERLDPYETRDRYHGLMHMTPAVDKM
jgi:hypothetical protein